MRWMIALLLLTPALPAAAQGPPACTAELEGQTSCMARKLCECRFERGGQLTGRPDRFVWDCGVMRPLCPPEPASSQGDGSSPPIGVWVQPQFGGGPGPLR